MRPNLVLLHNTEVLSAPLSWIFVHLHTFAVLPFGLRPPTRFTDAGGNCYYPSL